jgi:Flp pilus assembly protein TadG
MRLTPRDDSGVATIFIILCSLILLGAVGIAVDVSRAVAVTRSAQNSADAVALAMAKDCARTGSLAPPASYDRFIRPESAIGNGQSQARTAGSCPEGFVTARAEENMDYTFSQVFGASDTDRARSATARWGTVNGATTAPVVISQCTFDTAMATTGGTFPSAEVIIPLGSGGPACPGRPPGAFGWLDTGLDGPCSIENTLNASGQLVVHGNTGNGNVNPWACITQAGVNGTIMIPIYAASCKDQSPCALNENTGTGNNNWYLLLGFAEIQLTGWNLQHAPTNPEKKAGTPVPNCPGPGSASCLRGRFIQFTPQLGSTGPATNFGVQAVYLSN